MKKDAYNLIAFDENNNITNEKKIKYNSKIFLNEILEELEEDEFDKEIDEEIHNNQNNNENINQNI